MAKKISDKKNTDSGISRRSFLKGVGFSSVGVAMISGEGMVGKLQAAGIIPANKIIGPDAGEVVLNINDKEYKVVVETRTTLAETLRMRLDLTGTKIGCDRGACGACTVLMDGKPVSSCMTLTLDAVGTRIETIEGLASGERLHPLQESFIKHDAMQCGFCTSGMIISAKALYDQKPNPSDDEINKAVSGNLCRCGTYAKVHEAIKNVTK